MWAGSRRRPGTGRRGILMLAAALAAVALIVLGSPGETQAARPVAETVRLDGGAEVGADALIVTYEPGTVGRSRVAGLAALDPAESYPEVGAQVVELAEPAANAAGLVSEKERLEALPGVASVDYNSVHEPVYSPNDPYFGTAKQRNLRVVGAPRAWDFSRGGVRVAVLDGGCYGGHEELRGKIVEQTDVYYGDGVADDPILGHGTHVASVIAANTGNGRGIAGAAPAARLVCVKVADDLGGRTNDRYLMAGLKAARGMGAKVVNISLGSRNFEYNDAFAALTRHLYRENGIFIAAGAGNDNRYARAFYPAAYPGVMGVGGTGNDGTGRYLKNGYGSNWGPYVDIAAPAESVWGAVVSGPSAYVPRDGTSEATPQVSAAAALLAAKGASAQEIAQALTVSADDRGAPKRDDVFGAGLVDFDGALQYHLARQR